MAAGSSSNTLGQTYGSHIHTVEKRLITNADASVSALDRIFGPSGWDAQGWSALQAAEDRIGGDEAMRRDPTLIPVWSIEALFHKKKLQGQQSQPTYFLRFSQLPWRIKLYVFDKKRNIDNENNKYWL
ncbi:unnamed protein product [Fusarium graminearum]|uniref:Chromosome 1, complete genome n=1 Tax=Gibberella zeae (strain ATCC MYA-4620 / CBS 123657 / FGSC 9075 / NRRL 31084 / PH-1) TaxID=229533 RepID=A0A098D9N0_GIBZE|nr:unnamed protein product [Fusarium graminearum]